MVCLACLGSSEAVKANLEEVAEASNPPPKRISLEPQELYQVDDFPMEIEEAARWVVVRKPKPHAEYRMVCFGWAGGSSSIFKGWDLPDVEVVAAELPGRNARRKERPYSSVYPLVARLAEALDGLGYLRAQAPKLVLYGHSFGSLLAYHLACALRAAYGYTPHYLICGAGVPPRLRYPTPISSMSDDEIIAGMANFGGLPASIALLPQLKATHLPRIRADVACFDNYVFLEEPPLSCPILSIAATDDTLHHGGVMKRWEAYTTARFTLRTIDGNHYFTHTQKHEAMAIVKSVLLDGRLECDPIVIPEGRENEPFEWRGRPAVYGKQPALPPDDSRREQTVELLLMGLLYGSGMIQTAAG